ncbi:glucose 1-dehydrogenase [Novosphingobium sp. JCM 18896]|uniref:glucose 1-dehydrogenase n=1 Tax=Novosphingobium sp. JCM 18896 TaxID=2989731 RepID=UPI00222311E7|nr:glucose 1-dehydrogenase [Novosphingobium sp. JCM 18896]MCW1427532.1 glucose 1-dehydrogenase [Novosphingobium sp. JCM 18896]
MTAPRLERRVALVTGAAQGIGAAIAEGLAREGATVLATDRDAAGAQAVADRIVAAWGEGRAAAQALDVTREDDWKAAISVCGERFGGLNVLVNNAGIVAVGSVEDLDLETWRRSMAINADGPFLGCKYALPLMRESGPGSIVNMSSISAMIASHNMAAYNASKAALWMLTKSVALHCARKGWPIRCNSIHPTFVHTALLDGFVGDRDRDEILGKLARQVPIGRIGEVEDVVKAVIYLASDDSSMMTASELKLDGGLSAM